MLTYFSIMISLRAWPFYTLKLLKASRFASLYIKACQILKSNSEKLSWPQFKCKGASHSKIYKLLLCWHWYTTQAYPSINNTVTHNNLLQIYKIQDALAQPTTHHQRNQYTKICVTWNISVLPQFSVPKVPTRFQNWANIQSVILLVESRHKNQLHFFLKRSTKYYQVQ